MIYKPALKLVSNCDNQIESDKNNVMYYINPYFIKELKPSLYWAICKLELFP